MKIKITDTQLLEKMINFLRTEDADTIAGIAGEMFGGDCFFDDTTEENECVYEFTPNLLYAGEFDDLTLDKK